MNVTFNLTNTNTEKYEMLFNETRASSTTKTGRQEIAEILLKVALNTKHQSSINYP
jgi:hypothetical protein